MRKQAEESYELADERSEGNLLFRVWLRECTDAGTHAIEIAIQTIRNGVAEPLFVIAGEHWKSRVQAIARARHLQDSSEAAEQ